MGTRMPKVRGFGRPNRLIQELLIARAMNEMASGDKRQRRQPGAATTMSYPRRVAIYRRQNSGGGLTPAQSRRAVKKGVRLAIALEGAA